MLGHEIPLNLRASIWKAFYQSSMEELSFTDYLDYSVILNIQL